MATHVALLRGINVGGRNKVAMKDLREVVSDLGCSDVETYIQSGNVVFSSRASTDALRADLEAALAARFGITAEVVVVTRSRLAAVIAANPYPDVTDPKTLHVLFRNTPFGAADEEPVAEAVTRARARGCSDEVSAEAGVLYLWTPGGLGRSDLAAQLSRRATAGATARNWATVHQLDRMMGVS